jgi:hypothetical protein
MLAIFNKLREPNQSFDGFFQFYRDGYRTLEFSCLTNRGGRFVEVTEYHSGSHRGYIRVLEGRKGVGWSVFEFQARKYFLGEVLRSSAAQATSRQVSDEGVTMERPRDYRNDEVRRFGKSRELQCIKSAPETLSSDTLLKIRGRNSNKRVELATNAPRPTRSFYFEWKPKSYTIQITLDAGSRRRAKWVGLKTKDAVKAQQAVTKSTLDGPNSTLVGESGPDDDDGLNGLDIKKAEMGLSADQPIPNLLESDGVDSVRDEEGSEPEWASDLTRTTPTAVNTQLQVVFSPLKLPIESIPMNTAPMVRSGLSETSNQPTSLVRIFEMEGLASAPAQELNMVVGYVEENLTTTLEILPMDLSDGLTGEDPLSPLNCTPLCMMGPPLSSPGLGLIGDGIDALSQPSIWVAHHMNLFRKQVGVSIKGHEAKCLALLCKIEEDRKPKVTKVSVRKTVRKGNRELKNLASSVNYEGKQLRCC